MQSVTAFKVVEEPYSNHLNHVLETPTSVSTSVLTVEEFDEICEHSTNGSLDKIVLVLDKVIHERNFSVGPKTFCPDPIEQKPTPLVLSAQYGRGNVVDYFLKKYSDILDINHVATIVSLTTHKKVHCATALWAASTGGHLEIVKTLIAQGAEVNKATLTQSTPLRGASFHGYLKVMEYLLSGGAEIDTPNCIGQSPLCIAAMRGKIDAVKFLIDKGASQYQTTINGYTIMHLSATKGRIDVVKYLLSIGLPPMFREARPSESYIPCPLFLAASTGQRRMVDLLIEHPDCPPSCKADALLLLGSTRCEISSRGLTMGSRELWSQGLQIREENGVAVEFMEPNDSYGHRKEMQDNNDLNRFSSLPNFTRFEAYYQSLLIRERCMGFGDQGLIYFLIRRGAYLCSEQQKFWEAELLWFRAMDQEVKICEMEISHARYGHSEGLQRDLEKDLSQYAWGVWFMVHEGYRPDFQRYVEFGFKELEILEYLKEKSENAIFIDLRSLLGIMLYIFMSWIYYDTEVGGGDEGGRGQRMEGNTCSHECEVLGCWFVKKYLWGIQGSSLLHYALTNFVINDEQDEVEGYVYSKYSSLGKLVEALLDWGCYQVIDWPNGRGLRPIHVAAVTENGTDEGSRELVSSLVCSGAHLDAVSGDGRTLYELCNNESVLGLLRSNGPVTLACLAARSIIREGVPYTCLGLPTHILNLVQLHDRHSSDFSHHGDVHGNTQSQL